MRTCYGALTVMNEHNSHHTTGVLSVELPRISGREVCYVDLGCMTTDEEPFYHEEDRPVDWLPDSRDELGTAFKLHARELGDTYEELSTYDAQTIAISNFKPWRDTVVIIHGFVAGSDVDWMDDMSAEILAQKDYNIITVDWRPGVIRDDYEEATGNVRVLGAEIGLLVDMLVGIQGVGPETFHLIGHSLGAHAAGIAGAIVPNIGRITGLDPAGPYFDGCDPRIRIDPTDAKFVDIIHTDTDPLFKLGMGMYNTAGHLDFFPNSGRDQPGCDQRIIRSIIAHGIWGGLVDYVACNHIRAVELFTASINQAGPCPNMAFNCTREWDDYNEGLCYGDGEVKMGWYANLYQPQDGATEVVYQLNTVETSPYCAFQYRFNVQIDDGKKAEDTNKGQIFISLVGDDGESETFSLSPDFRVYEPLTNYLHIGASSVNVGFITRLYFEWDYDAEFYKPWEWEFFENPKLYIHQIIIDSAENGESYLMCGSYEAIEPDTPRVFFRVDVCD
ncbi:pancreatic lipase-related protein 2-like [Diadema antillarum]|uniref:pancreatic lipase-related protein 2-like n=1 Tax=Diadema antillarum TaxID=105358 RepID=UPI003A888344